MQIGEVGVGPVIDGFISYTEVLCVSGKKRRRGQDLHTCYRRET